MTDEELAARKRVIEAASATYEEAHVTRRAAHAVFEEARKVRHAAEGEFLQARTRHMRLMDQLEGRLPLLRPIDLPTRR